MVKNFAEKCLKVLALWPLKHVINSVILCVVGLLTVNRLYRYLFLIWKVTVAVRPVGTDIENDASNMLA